MKTSRFRATLLHPPALHSLGILAILAALLGPGCASRTSEPPQPPPSEKLLGVTLTPRSFEAGDFTEFWNLVGETGSVVAWYGDWLELADSVGPPDVVSSLTADRAMVPFIAAQFFSQKTGALLRPLDDATRMLYKKSAARFAARRHPRFLAFGIEVNILYEKNPAAFQDFVDFYPEVYDTVRAVSPSTIICTIFQLEKMQGMNGGLFGGVNDPAQAEWHLLDRFPKSDLTAFTTYPCLVFGDPASIPSDYYRAIRSRSAKPIAFTEIGWHAAAAPAGWESSDSEQSAAVDTIFAKTAELEPRLRIWSFLYDPPEAQPFGSLGLRRPDHSPRPAWARWIAHATRLGEE